MRTVALNAIRQLSSDELLDYLPQLVQVSVQGVREGIRYDWRREDGVSGVMIDLLTGCLLGCFGQ